MKTLWVFATLLLCAAAARAEDVVFIAHPGVADTVITAAEVKNILLGTKTSWRSGPLRLAVQREGPVHEWVVREFTQRTPDQFDKFWKKQVFTGKGTMPAILKNDADVVAFVAETIGAFGYVARPSLSSRVKVLELRTRVEGAP